MLSLQTALRIRGCSDPSVVHFSISPAARQGKAADAVAAFADIRSLATSSSGNHLRVVVRMFAENREYCTGWSFSMSSGIELTPPLFSCIQSALSRICS